MITILSVRVTADRHDERGRPLYRGDWVNRLHAMAERNISQPCRHLCLTDTNEGIDSRITPIDISRWWSKLRLRNGWWAKVKLFDPDLPILAKGDRILFLDLDNLVIRSLDGMIASVADKPIAFAPHTAPNFRPPGTVNIYSSACILWNHGAAPDLFTAWTRDVTHRLRGDQDWFATRRPNEAKIDGIYFQRLSESVRNGRPREGAAVIFCVKPKNHIAAKQSPWVAKIWKGFDR